MQAAHVKAFYQCRKFDSPGILQQIYITTGIDSVVIVMNVVAFLIRDGNERRKHGEETCDITGISKTDQQRRVILVPTATPWLI